MLKTAFGVWLGGLMILAMVACGPVTSTMSINDADRAVEMARLEGAEELAVYEFVSAEEYLRKAREEWGYSDYQKAEEFADLALDFAERALERAVNLGARRQDPTDFDQVDDMEGLDF